MFKKILLITTTLFCSIVVFAKNNEGKKNTTKDNNEHTEAHSIKAKPFNNRPNKLSDILVLPTNSKDVAIVETKKGIIIYEPIFAPKKVKLSKKKIETESVQVQ